VLSALMRYVGKRRREAKTFRKMRNIYQLSFGAPISYRWTATLALRAAARDMKGPAKWVRRSGRALKKAAYSTVRLAATQAWNSASSNR
jgi:hypothetical protein